jgi:signal recognition particle GTPase
MVLAELGQKLNKALGALSRHSNVDEAAVDACLKEITTALL